MCSSCIFVLIFTFAVIHKAQSDCDPQMCNNVCEPMSGICNGNSCDCSTNKKCSEMKELTCDVFCKQFKLEGECDDDGCICKAELGFCTPILGDCEESCREDPRARECLWVNAIACVEYGPIETCVCECIVWSPAGTISQNSQSDEKRNSESKINQFIQWKVNNSTNFLYSLI